MATESGPYWIKPWRKYAADWQSHDVIGPGIGDGIICGDKRGAATLAASLNAAYNAGRADGLAEARAIYSAGSD